MQKMWIDKKKPPHYCDGFLGPNKCLNQLHAAMQDKRVSFERQIPESLKSFRRWILWRLETRDGTQTKVPYTARGTRASSTNANDWTDFTTALHAFDPKRFSGIGFVLTKEDGITCLDLDGCIDENGNIVPEAMHIVERLNSWTEISQSGRGLHIFVFATKSANRSKAVPKSFKAIEIYDHARFIALTGNHLKGTPLTIEARQAELDELCLTCFPEPTPQVERAQSQNISLTDEQIISLCRRAKNGDKFEALFERGDVSLYDHDESRADEALACLFAFYTRDVAQLERLMSASALGRREKWRRRKDYRDRTIARALALTREHYNPQRNLTDVYPLQSLNGNAPEPIDDGEDEAVENDVMVLFPELPDGLVTQLFSHINCRDVPKEFALTGAIALISAIIGDRIGLQFGDVMIYPNDFYVQIGKSGSGKSSTSQIVCSLLRKVDEKIWKTDGKRSHLIYANSVTLRGLIDQIRCESDVERAAREAAERAAEKNASKFVPAERKPQMSGLWVIDEFAQLLLSFKREFNAELNSFLLSLWDNREMSFSTKSDGRFVVPQTAVTMLANSTPKRFVEALPEHARSDGFIQRMLIVRSDEKRRKTMLQIISAPTVVESDALCDKLLSFFSFCARRPKVRFLAECVEIEKAFVEKYFSHDESLDAFLARANARLLKMALIVATCRAFEMRAAEIVVGKEVMLEASNLLDFFIKSTLQFWSESDLDAEKPIDAVGRTKSRIITLLREKFSGEVRRKVLRDYLRVRKSLFEESLSELVETQKIYIEERPNAKGVKTHWIVLLKKQQSPSSPSSLSSLSSLCEISLSVTQPKPKNTQSEEKKVKKQNEEESEIPVPEPTNATDVALHEPTDLVEPEPEPTPQPDALTSPMPAPEPGTTTTVMPAAPKPGPTAPKRSANPLPKPESLLLANACEIARSLHTEFTAREFINEAMLFHGTSFEIAKKMLNAMLREGYILQGKYTYVRTSKLYSPEPKPKPLEPEPESPVEPVGLPFPDAATIDDLAGYTMNYLEQTWSRKKIPGDQLRAAIGKIAEKRANVVWSVLFPVHIVKLHTTDFYILRKHELRPPGYEGLLDDKGVLPDADPAPF